MTRFLCRLAVPLCLALAVGACELPEWMGEAEGPPLPGERISVLRLDAALSPDPGIADVSVQLSPPWRNVSWPQAGGVPGHAMYHLEVAEAPTRAWRIDAGEGSGGETRLLSAPIVADGRIYVLDTETELTAFDAENGERLWRRNLLPEGEEEGALGGGIAYHAGRLVVSTGYGIVYGLDPEDGAGIWEQNVGLPVRGAPTASGDRVFVITYDNQLHALSMEDGRELWTHSGLPEDAGLVGSPSPAVDGGVVVAPYTSGEVVALRIENGRVLWSDQLIRSTQLTPLAALSEIRGHPVIDRGLVIAISHSGRIAAIDMRTGQRLWDRDIEGIETPWIAGEFVFLVSTQSEVVALSRRNGRVRWVTQLQRYEDEEDREGPIHWSGPVLVTDRLVLAGSHGEAVTVSPYTGEILGRIELPDRVMMAPIVANGTLYFLTDGADLIAYR